MMNKFKQILGNFKTNYIIVEELWLKDLIPKSGWKSKALLPLIPIIGYSLSKLSKPAYAEIVKVNPTSNIEVEVEKGDWAFQILRDLGVKEEDLPKAIDALIKEQESFLGPDHPLIEKYKVDKMDRIFPGTSIYLSENYAKRFGIDINNLEKRVKKDPRQRTIRVYQEGLFGAGIIDRVITDVETINWFGFPAQKVTTEKRIPLDYEEYRLEQGKPIKDQEREREIRIYN